MKILFYLDHFPGGGGIERITSQLATLFVSNLNHEVGIFSFSSTNSDSVPLPTGINFLHLATKDNSINPEKQLDEVLTGFKPDIVIFQDSYAPVDDILLKAKARHDFKLIICEHNTPDCFLRAYHYRWSKHSWLNPKGFLKRIAYPYIYHKINSSARSRHKKLIEAADSYVVLSESYLELLENMWGLTSSKMISIPNMKFDFRSVESPDYLPTNLTEDKKRKEVLFVGRLTEDKGIAKLINIWEKIEHNYPDWILTVAGTGELQNMLEEEIKRRGLKRINPVGFVKDISNLYKRASFLFMTSIFEGLALVLAEAMEFGVIPIAFDSFSAAKDLINHGETGFLIKPFDEEKFFQMFSEIVSFDKTKMNNMRELAVQTSSRFSKDNVISRWDNLLKMINTDD